MHTEKELEEIAYFAAIDNVLAEKNLNGIDGKDESKLVSAMLNSERHFLDCVEAIMIFRKRGKIDCI